MSVHLQITSVNMSSTISILEKMPSMLHTIGRLQELHDRCQEDLIIESWRSFKSGIGKATELLRHFEIAERAYNQKTRTSSHIPTETPKTSEYISKWRNEETGDIELFKNVLQTFERFSRETFPGISATTATTEGSDDELVYVGSVSLKDLPANQDLQTTSNSGPV